MSKYKYLVNVSLKPVFRRTVDNPDMTLSPHSYKIVGTQFCVTGVPPLTVYREISSLCLFVTFREGHLNSKQSELIIPSQHHYIFNIIIT